MAPDYIAWPDDYQGVRYCDPDGLYLNPHCAPDIQIVSVGPVVWTPAEIVAHHPGYRLKGVEILPPAPELSPERRRMVIERLFLSIDLEPA